MSTVKIQMWDTRAESHRTKDEGDDTGSSIQMRVK